MNNYAIDELTAKLEMLKYYRGLVQGDKNIGSQRDKAISQLQAAIKQLSSTDKVIAEGEICVKDSDEVLFGFVGKDLQSDFDDCILENGLCGHKAKLILREVK